MTGLNLHLYPSELRSESRLLRLSRSVQESGAVKETHIVGIAGERAERREKVSDGVFLVRMGRRAMLTWLPSGVLSKAISAIRWNRAVYRVYAKRECSVVAAHSVWVFPLAFVLARRTGAVLAYNPHEFETGTPTMRGAKKLAACGIEKALLSKASIFSCVNDSIADLYQQRCSVRPVVVRNLPAQVDMGEGMDLRATLGLMETDRIFVHTGNLTSGRNIPLILDVFAGIPEAGYLVFVGDGPLHTQVDEACERHKHIHRVPPVPATQVVGTVRTADVSLCLIDTASPSYYRSSPNKLFEGLSAGLPVLCSDLPEARRALGSDNERWILRDPHAELCAFVESLDEESIERFPKVLPPLGNWEDEVSPLIRAYRTAVREGREVSTP